MKSLFTKKKNLFAKIFAFLFLFVPFTALATGIGVIDSALGLGSSGEGGWGEGLDLARSTSFLPTSDFHFVLVAFLLWLFFTLTILAVIAFVGSGITFLVSGGSTELATRARRWLTYSIIGLAIALASISILLTVVSIVGFPIVSLALGLLGIGVPGTVDEIFVRLMEWLLLVLTFLSVISFVTSGVMLILSGGNSEMATRARRWIVYSIAGLTVALGAYSIIRWVDNMTDGAVPVL